MAILEFHRRLHVILVICVYTCLVRGQTVADVKNLITKLFTTDGYNKNVRPIADQTQAVAVGCDFVLTSIIDFNEQDESLKTSGYLAVVWEDVNLVWTAADYGGIQTLQIPQNDVWRPDVSLRNNFKSNSGLGSSFLNVRIDASGVVEWTPFEVLESTCDMDITYFPFDTQTCEMKFIAWSYSQGEVEINMGKKGIYLEEFSPNSLWALVSTSAEEVNTGEAAVIFTMKLKRKPIFYIITIIIPVVFLSFLNIMTFVLPVTSGERASYSITVFLSLAVFLTIVASELPKNSDVISIMSVYLTTMSALSTLIVCVCLVQLRIAKRNTDDEPIGRIYKSIYVASRRLRCKFDRKKVEPSDENFNNTKEDDTLDKTPDRKLTWMDVIGATDYLLFWIFLLLTFIATVALGVICVNN